MEQLIEITSQEFLEKQKIYFDLADKGAKIILKRDRRKSYVLTPLTEEDIEPYPKMLLRIEKGLQEIEEGKTKRYTMEELQKRMGL